jgi:hypothetical protein
MTELPKVDSPRAAVWREQRRLEHAQRAHERGRREGEEQDARRRAALPERLRALVEQDRTGSPRAKGFLEL